MTTKMATGPPNNMARPPIVDPEELLKIQENLALQVHVELIQSIEKNDLIKLSQIIFLLKDFNISPWLHKDKPLIVTAACDDNNEVMKILLTHPLINVNEPDSRGYTALIEAARNDNLELVQLLLSFPLVDVNKRATTYGSSALIVASFNNFPRIVDCLLNHPGIAVDLPDNHGNTALSYGTRNNHIEVSKLLRLHHADVTFVNNENQNPIEAAVERQHDDLVRWIKSTLDFSKLHIAIDIGAVDSVIRLIRDQDADLKDDNNHLALSPLELAKAKCKPRVESKEKMESEDDGELEPEEESEELVAKRKRIMRLLCLANQPWSPVKEMQVLWSRHWKRHALAFTSVNYVLNKATSESKCSSTDLQKHRRATTPCVPLELFHYILSFTSRDWFDRP